MGLDQYASKIKDGEKEQFFQWRKHPAIQDWMEELWEEKGRPGFDPEKMGCRLGDFNNVPVLLTKDDLEKLKEDIEENCLNYSREGFFFGNSPSPGEDYFDSRKSEDLEFVDKALLLIEEGFEIEYDSWW